MEVEAGADVGDDAVVFRPRRAEELELALEVAALLGGADARVEDAVPFGGGVGPAEKLLDVVGVVEVFAPGSPDCAHLARCSPGSEGGSTDVIAPAYLRTRLKHRERVARAKPTGERDLMR